MAAVAIFWSLLTHSFVVLALSCATTSDAHFWVSSPIVSIIQALYLLENTFFPTSKHLPA